MQVNGVSFKGLWEVGHLKKVKSDYRPHYYGQVFEQSMIYHPYKDDNEETIKADIAKYKGKAFAFTHDDTYYGNDEIYIPQVELGDTLALTKKECNYIKRLRAEMYQHHDRGDMSVLCDSETQEIKKSIRYEA